MDNKKNDTEKSGQADTRTFDSISMYDEDTVDAILAEARHRKEESEMERAASKYRERPKMDEIFSNTSRERRFTNKNPLEVDDETEKKDKNVIVDEQTAATIKASILMDSPDMPGEDEKAEKVTEEKSEKEEMMPAVTLSPVYEKGTQIAGDIIQDVDQFNVDTDNLEQIDTIDIDLTAESADKTENEPKEETKPVGEFEKKFGRQTPASSVQTVVSKVPVYQHESKVEKIKVKAGRFSQVVAEEYQQYLKSKDPSISKSNTPVRDENADEPYVKVINEKIVGKMVDFFATESDEYKAESEKEKVPDVEDYTSPQDAKSIMFEIKSNLRSLFLRSVVMGIIVICSLVLTIMMRVSPGAINASIPAAPVLCALFNLILTAASIFTCRVTVFSGLSPLIKLRGNSDTALAVAAVAAAAQSLVAVFVSSEFFSGALSYYSVIVNVAFFANTLGKYFMVKRVKDNFRFVASKGQKYSAKIYTDEETAAKIMSGTVISKPIIAYQHKTDFLSNFLKLSYAPDQSEEMSGKFAPFTTLSALLIAIVYGIVFQSFAEAVSVYALVTAVSVPVCNMLAANLPLKTFAKKLLSKGAMVSGYPAIKQFCDSSAVIVDACDLYPKGSVKLDGIKTFVSHKIDDTIMAAAAVMKEANSPMASIFGTLLEEHKKEIPSVESVLYEDGMGLVGWVNNERILLGTHELLEKYSVETPSADYEERYRLEGKKITYLAEAGRLVAMFVTTYVPDIEMAHELQNAEDNGVSIVVRTTDCNITGEMLAEHFGIFYRTIKVLPIGLGNVCKEATEQKTAKSRAYMATTGKASSLLSAVAGCVKIKGNISLAVAIQSIAIILGIAVSAIICLYAGVVAVQTIEILLFSLFWAAAVIIVPMIRRP